MPANKRAIYESQEFRQRWFSSETIQSIADDYGVTKVAVWKAAQRRGWPSKFWVRRMAEKANVATQ